MHLSTAEWVLLFIFSVQLLVPLPFLTPFLAEEKLISGELIIRKLSQFQFICVLYYSAAEMNAKISVLYWLFNVYDYKKDLNVLSLSFSKEEKNKHWLISPL